MKTLLILVTIAACLTYGQTASKYIEGEIRPYEFGYSIERHQHRKEKKDANGIIMGEFGFVTGDGVYHATVYATDENGKFKILSMKSVKVGLPGEPEIKTTISTTPFQTQKPEITTTIPKKSNFEPIKFRPTSDTPSCSNCRIPVPIKDQSDKDSGNNRSVNDVDVRSSFPSRSDQNNGANVNDAVQPQITPDNGPLFQLLSKSVPDSVPTNTGSIQREDNLQDSGLGSSTSSQNDESSYGLVTSTPSYGSDPQQNQFQVLKPTQKIQSSPLNTLNLPETKSNTRYNSKPVQNTENTYYTENSPQTIQNLDQSSELSDYNHADPRPFSVGDPNSANPALTTAQLGKMKQAIIGLLYKFNYTAGYHGHHEQGDSDGSKEGGYFFVGRDGLRRTVDYTANEFGFQPHIKLETVDPAETPKEESEKEAGLKGYEFKWFNAPDGGEDSGV